MAIVFGNRCNLRCVMCGSKGLFTRMGIKKESKLSDDSLKEAISYFPYMQSIFLSGGEPLTYNESKRVVETAAKYPNLRIDILTNGNLINDYWVEHFCEIPFKILSISIDAATEKTYNTIRIRGNFKKVLKSIKQINDLKTGKEPEILIGYVVMRRNKHEILDFLELAHKYNVSRVSYQTIWNMRFLFYLFENITPQEKICAELLKVGDKVLDLADDYGIKCIYRVRNDILRDKPSVFYEHYRIKSSDLNDDAKFECDVYWKNLDISPNYYTTCVFSIQKKYEPIQYYNQKAPNPLKIIDVWNCEKLQKARKLIIDHQYNKVCKISCPKYFNFKTEGVI